MVLCGCRVFPARSSEHEIPCKAAGCASVSGQTIRLSLLVPGSWLTALCFLL